MVQRIWNSPVLSARLKVRIKSLEDSKVGTAANLKAAKHRFESFAAPLGRMLLHLEEFLDLVQETCDMRGDSKEADDCQSWLAGLDEEKLLQLAMLADCSDEILVATRGMDFEDVDTSTMHATARDLLDRLDALFNKEQCVGIPGYTQHVMDVLKKPRIIHCSGGLIKSIGGGDNSNALQNCLQRMTAYTALVADVVQTEFPDYELFCAFSIFNLEGNSRVAGAINDAALQRLSRALDVNHAALVVQYHRLRAVAMQRKKDGMSLSNKDAWKDAVRSCKRASATIASWSLDAVLPVLWRYAGWTAATSGVEQNFSKALRSIGPQRGSLTPENEETALRLAVYKPDSAEEEDVIARARAIWHKHYGSHRQYNTTRCDKGTHRDQASTNTEKAWLDKRRAAAQEVGAKLGNASTLTIESAAGGTGWTDGHDHEHDFQVKKRAKKELQALDDGLLLDHEVRPGMRDQLHKMKLIQKKDDRANKRKILKQQTFVKTGKSLPLIIKPGTVACVTASTGVEELSKILNCYKAAVHAEPSVRTQLLVVDNPADLPKVHKWMAALSGMLVTSAQAVLALHRGQHVGSFLKFRRAVAHTKRCLYMAPEFQHKHNVITKLLQEACQLQGSRWRISDVENAKCTVLGGPRGVTAKQFLRTLTYAIRSESRAR